MNSVWFWPHTQKKSINVPNHELQIVRTKSRQNIRHAQSYRIVFFLQMPNRFLIHAIVCRHSLGVELNMEENLKLLCINLFKLKDLRLVHATCEANSRHM